MLTRRALCQTAAAVVVSALTGCGGSRYHGPERTITIAGGQPGGFYLEVAELLAREVTAAEPSLSCTAIETGGSVDNVRLISSGHADVGVCQSDVALTALQGASPFTDVLAVKGIGRMYEDYLQLVVRADSGLSSIADLDGATVSVGAKGSGSAFTGERLIDAAKLSVTRKREPLNDAAAALAARRVDALVWSGGVPTPVLTTLHHKVGIRLLPLIAMLPALRGQNAMPYQQVPIPAGGYGQPGMLTIGVANLLMCGRSLPDDVVTAITGVLVERATRLVPPQALGTQFLDQRALICLLGVPMHPGAATAYRHLHG